MPDGMETAIKDTDLPSIPVEKNTFLQQEYIIENLIKRKIMNSIPNMPKSLP
jgi:hypothetical protein